MTGSELIARGWTRAAIRRFLGKPDRVESYGVRRHRRVTRYHYSDERVLTAESTPEFAGWRAGCAARSERAKRTAERRRAEVLEYARTVPLSVPEIPLKILQGNALESYYSDPRSECGGGNDPLFIGRITANYIRHELTSYDAIIVEMAARPGTDDAYEILRDRVDDLIAERYPDLEEAIRAQARLRFQRQCMEDGL